MSEVQIPELTVYQCVACGNQTVAEKGQQMLCNTCVNTFLARNVGLMEPGAEDRKPAPEPLGVVPGGVEGDGTG